jgi:hypothetical protein
MKTLRFFFYGCVFFGLTAVIVHFNDTLGGEAPPKIVYAGQFEDTDESRAAAMGTVEAYYQAQNADKSKAMWLLFSQEQQRDSQPGDSQRVEDSHSRLMGPWKKRRFLKIQYAHDSYYVTHINYYLNGHIEEQLQLKPENETWKISGLAYGNQRLTPDLNQSQLSTQ